jgi:hypothetical protein
LETTLVNVKTFAEFAVYKTVKLPFVKLEESIVRINSIASPTTFFFATTNSLLVNCSHAASCARPPGASNFKRLPTCIYVPSIISFDSPVALVAGNLYLIDLISKNLYLE